MGGPSSPRRHAGVFTSRLQGTDSEKGVWFCGHGSFNQKTDRSHKYKIPTWLKGGVYFWCHDRQTLKAVLSEVIIDNPSVAAIQSLIKAKFGERYRDHNFDNLPVHYQAGEETLMYRLTNADDNAMTPTIMRHPNVITVPSGRHWPERSRTIEALIEDNERLIRDNGYRVHWLACRVHKADR